MNKINNLKFIAITAFIVLNMGFSGFAKAASADTLVEMANSSRGKEGLANLVINDKLTIAARSKAEDIFQKQYFAHISPDGKTPWDFMNTVDYKYAYAGENLAIGYTNDKELHDAWMASQTHRANIMNENYSDIGIAVVNGKYQGSDTTVVVQMFGQLTFAPQVLSATTSSQPLTGQMAKNESSDLKYLFVIPFLIVLFGIGYFVYRTQKTHRLA